APDNSEAADTRQEKILRSAFYALTTTVQSQAMTRQLLACNEAKHHVETINGIRLHFLQSGPDDAPPVFFLHGGAAHAHWFDRVVPGLTTRIRAIALDQRGHGESQWPTPAAYATEDFASDLLALMAASAFASIPRAMPTASRWTAGRFCPV